jgi:hypothetical protein
MSDSDILAMRLNLTKATWDAFYNDDLARLRTCLEMGADPNMPFARYKVARWGQEAQCGKIGSFALLTVAANSKTDDHVRLLLEFGAEKTEEALFYASKPEDFKQPTRYGLSDETIEMLKPE